MLRARVWFMLQAIFLEEHAASESFSMPLALGDIISLAFRHDTACDFWWLDTLSNRPPILLYAISLLFLICTALHVVIRRRRNIFLARFIIYHCPHNTITPSIDYALRGLTQEHTEISLPGFSGCHDIANDLMRPFDTAFKEKKWCHEILIISYFHFAKKAKFYLFRQVSILIFRRIFITPGLHIITIHLVLIISRLAFDLFKMRFRWCRHDESCSFLLIDIYN